MNFQFQLKRLLDLEIWVVGFLVAATFFSSALLILPIIAAIFFSVVRWISIGRISQHSPIDLIVFSILIWGGISFLVSNQPEVTSTQLLRLMNGLVLFYTVINWTGNKQRLRWLLSGLIAVGFVFSIFAFISVDWSTDKLFFIPSIIYDRFIILVSDTVNPNVLAGNLVILLPFALTILFFSWKQISRFEKGFAVVSAVSMLVMIALSQARGAWIALFITLMVFISLRWQWGWVVPAISAVLIVGLILWMQNTTIYYLLVGGIQGLINNRSGIWERAILLIKLFPLTGTGMGGYQDLSELIHPLLESSTERIPHAHNLLFQVALDLGIPGLISYLAGLLVIFSIAMQVFRDKITRLYPLYLSAAAGTICSLVAFLVHGLLDAVTWGMVRPAPLVWVIWALTVAVTLLIHSESKLMQQ
jgi:putative inorganic carbon (HCO3(-)) transporter